MNHNSQNLHDRHNLERIGLIGRHNYLKEGLIKAGYWDKQDEKTKEIINSLPKI